MSAKYSCPKCHTSESLEVVIQRWALLVQFDDGDAITAAAAAEDQSEEWDDTSQMKCGCGHTGAAKKFLAST